MISSTLSQLDFAEVRTLSETLVAPLQPEDTVVQPSADASPPKWHLAHTTWFFECFILENFFDGYRSFNPDFSYLFNSYYESVGKRVLRPQRGNITRPGLADILDYRRYVNEQMAAFLVTPRAQEPQVQSLIQLGLHHEQQHQELLLMDVKVILGTNPLFPAYHDLVPRPAPPAQAPGWLTVDEGVYEVGHHGEGFHYDNERGRHKVYVPHTQLQDRLVTNGEYLQFVQQGGYEDFRPWLSDGWDWVQAHQVKAPLYWHQLDGQWHEYTLAGLQPLDPNAPVTHISFYEADAFAAWAGLRLPTEQEWEVAALHHAPQVDEASANLLATGRLHPGAPRTAHQLVGEGWEWTQSAYVPYPGFAKAEGAVGEYNGKFMVNQKVLRGGSCFTPPGHYRHTYRNFFHADKRWQVSSLRLSKHLP